MPKFSYLNFTECTHYAGFMPKFFHSNAQCGVPLMSKISFPDFRLECHQRKERHGSSHMKIKVWEGYILRNIGHC